PVTTPDSASSLTRRPSLNSRYCLAAHHYHPEGRDMHCKHCGKSIDDDSKFCRFCGWVQITSPNVTPATTPPAALVEPAHSESDPVLKKVAWIGGAIFLLIVVIAILGGSNSTPG